MSKNLHLHRDRLSGKNKPLPQNRVPMDKMNKLLKQGRLLPIYNAVGETLCLVGYRRKPTSRKAHQRPFMLKQPIPMGPIETNPEAP
jgi:hypothetical protein